MTPEDLVKFLERHLVNGDDCPYSEMLEAHQYLRDVVENQQDTLEDRVRLVAKLKDKHYPHQHGQLYNRLPSRERIDKITHDNGRVIVTWDGENFTFPIELLDSTEEEITNHYSAIRVSNENEITAYNKLKQEQDLAAQKVKDLAEYERLKKIFEPK
jgi:hypothetical protein